MVDEAENGNVFLVHGKSGLSIYKSPLQGQNSVFSSGDSDASDAYEPANLNINSSWSLDRPVKLFCKSPLDTIAVVDERTGLSIVHAKSLSTLDINVDTLRGVGKYKNYYTPIGCKNIKHLQWSDSGTYLVVYFNLGNFTRENGLSAEDNLHIWDTESKNIITTFSTRRLSPDQWPIIKWFGKRDAFCFCGIHQVSAYTVGSPEESLKSVKLHFDITIPRVFSLETQTISEREFALSCFTKADVANLISGSLTISTISVNDNGDYQEVSASSHELHTADFAEMLWSSSGKYLLLLSQSTVDLAGEKYGSSTDCLLYSNSGKFVARVNTSTVHDARWNPVADEFILLQGNMPCDIYLYRLPSLQVIYEFPKLYRNTVIWSDMGNMIALCGFGNLAGEVCFWYKDTTPKEEHVQLERIVQLKEPCTVVAAWSPDSRFFMTASTYPRMKVDNFFKIFTCEGDLLARVSLDECYGVSWMRLVGDCYFTRPKAKKNQQQREIYRPKCSLNSGSNSSSSPTAAGISALECGTIATDDINGSTGVNNTKSLFNLQGVTDPNVSLMEVFAPIFSMVNTTQGNFATTNLTAMVNGMTSVEGYSETGAIYSSSSGVASPELTAHAPHNDSNDPTNTTQLGGNNEAAQRSLSMLVRIKNQITAENVKPIQQSIMDEDQLLKILLDAKDKSQGRKGPE